MLQPVNFVRLAVLDILSYLLSRAIQYHAPKLPPLHPLEAINSLKPADWETGFKAKLTAKSLMPYKEYTGIIEQSGNDKRQHRLIRLPNNLVALCVQDTDAKEAAASLSVNVGSSADPIELQGLAHFLEHMLFLGTEKYPQEGEYNAYLAKHSGRSNAYTSFTETNYYFSVFNGALENALDRFSQFFISPLLNTDCVDRELNAVDSEHKGYLQSDSWRTYQLVAMTSNPAHPYSGFNVGNIETLKGAAEKLGLDLREELIKFYQKYYSADIMRLTVVGNHSLDVLTEWVVSKFSEIASKGNTKPTFVGHPIGKAQLGKLVHYKTVIESYLLRLQFSLPELKSIYKENQYTYIDALLNHKGPGSIFSVLRKNSWATEINCGSSGVYYDGFGIYEIDIDATPEGLDNYEAIYDADLISKCLRYLNPNNYRLFIGAQEHKAVECKLEEKYYGVLHNIAELPSHLTSNVKCSRSVSKQLHLPDHNAFLPDNLSVSKPDVLANPPAVEPVLLRKNDKIEVWFKKDDQFFTPHGHIEALKDVTLDGLQAHAESVLGKAYVKMIMSGNYTQSVALDTSSQGESNPAYVTQRINQFIREYRLRLIELSTEEFESSVQSLISLKQEKLLSMDDEFSRLWVHISSDEYMFDTLDKEVEQLKQLSKDNLLEFWDKYINKDTAKHYTRLDMQMWSTKIWQPTPEEFEMYPSAVLSLFGCLCSGGHTALSITEVHSFILSVTTSNSIDTVLEELGELYMSKQAPSTTNADSARTAFGTSSKIATALQMAISSAQDMPNFANQSKTNFASIGMKQSPEGIWLINDYTQFKSSQALHGLPVPVRSFVPLIPEPVPVEVSE
ncbi:metalloprotease [Coemansia sp. RSA 2675]|nr:metalloprotease [Coemansia sp. RSA 2675]